jgi:hypothetical protein
MELLCAQFNPAIYVHYWVTKLSGLLVVISNFPRVNEKLFGSTSSKIFHLIKTVLYLDYCTEFCFTLLKCHTSPIDT